MEEASGRGFELALVKDPRQKWRLEFDAEGASLAPVAEPQQRLRVYREHFAAVFEILPVLGSSVLIVRHAVRTVKLRVDPGDADAVERALGARGPEFLQSALRRRYALALPIAGLWLLLEMLGGDAVPPGPDPVVVGLGLGLAGLWVWSRLRPMPIAFLADALWFTLAATNSAIYGLRRGSVGGWLFAVLGLLVAGSAVRQYRRFRGGAAAGAPAPALPES